MYHGRQNVAGASRRAAGRALLLALVDGVECDVDDAAPGVAEAEVFAQLSFDARVVMRGFGRGRILAEEVVSADAEEIHELAELARRRSDATLVFVVRRARDAERVGDLLLGQMLLFAEHPQPQGGYVHMLHLWLLVIPYFM